MNKREVLEFMGCPTAEPADADENGNVEQTGYGLVVIREDGPGLDEPDLHQYLGKVGYYDDDEWEPNDAEAWNAISESHDDGFLSGKEADELLVDEEGTDYAIVYFCEPFTGPYSLIRYDWLRPATPEEALAYSLNPPPPAPRDPDENSIVIAVHTNSFGMKQVVHSCMDYGDGAGIELVQDAVEGGVVPKGEQKNVEIRICRFAREQLIEMSEPIPVESLKD